MDKPILIDDITSMFDSELIGFLAQRYNKPVQEIIRQFLFQNETGHAAGCEVSDFTLETNEMEILRAYYNHYINN